jgi:hypothetical protein
MSRNRIPVEVEPQVGTVLFPWRRRPRNQTMHDSNSGQAIKRLVGKHCQRPSAPAPRCRPAKTPNSLYLIDPPFIVAG